jgi:hypothetical protein
MGKRGRVGNAVLFKLHNEYSGSEFGDMRAVGRC